MRNTLKFFAFVAAGCLPAFAADAQDKIYLTDGSHVDASVKEITPRQVTYTLWHSSDDNRYSVSRREVIRIIFENGMEQEFQSQRGPAVRTSSAPKHKTEMLEYGKNILSFSPMQMTNESAAGVGLAYERVADKRGYVSVVIPVAMSFVQNGYYDVNNTWHTDVTGFTSLFPGLKFYPATCNHRVTYSIGPAFGIGFGDKMVDRTIYDPKQGYYVRTRERQFVFKAGFILNNALNIQISEALYLGLEGGLGIYYFNNEDEEFRLGSDEPMVQLNFRIGYRF